MFQTQDGHGRLELSSTSIPQAIESNPACSNEIGMHLSHSADGVSNGSEADAGEASLVVHRNMPLDAPHDEAVHRRALAQQQGITYDG